MRRDLPSGTVTFLFTDVEGSTRLLHELGAEGYAEALAEHRRVIRAACVAKGGVEVDTQGDAFFFAFPTAPGALAAAGAFTELLSGGPIQVRVGLHTGTPLLAEEGYVGDDVHFAARVAATSHGGQVVLSAATAELVDVSLLDLGEHRLKDIAQAVAIFQLGSEPFPPLKTISNTNLPRPASSFLGRGAELQEVLSRIEKGARLVTLTGPGGTGKTRLALEAASTLVPSYKAGVFWIGLASLRDPSLVTETIAQTLGAKDGLPAHVGERELLLLLDNLEQVIECAPELSRLLETCPNLALLVTSRELLRVQGEVEYAVPPLAESEAVSLFCARSQLEPSEEVAELCARLDSLPLAVELAAARAKALSPPQILERLSGRLDLLKGGRDADPRQQTLRATIEWSYELLSPEEQELFARLSVFVGGCILEAAEEVCDADLDTLQSLLEKSLLRFTASDTGGRYWMLETIREYASSELEAAGEHHAICDRHLRFFIALARATGPDLQTGREGVASARLADEYENIRAAISHAFVSARPDDSGVVLGALWPFLITRGHLAEGREWAERALCAPELSSDGRVEALVAAGEFARFGGDLDLAVELKEELVALEAAPQRPRWAAATFADLSEIALDQGDFERARHYAKESARRGGAERAELVFAELHLREGDLAAAERSAYGALEGHEDGEFNYACALEILGEAARRAGDAAGARGWFVAALRRFSDLRDAGGVADCLDGLARLAVAERDSGAAGRLVGAASRLRQESGRRPIRADVPLPEVPAGALLEGRSLSLDAAVELALAPLD